jgi:uncharacterized FlgJ-related protein
MAMSQQSSFTRFENQALPMFRMKLSKAESTEDVKKFFFQTMRDLFDRIFGQQVDLEREYLVLAPGETPCLHMHEALTSQPAFQEAMNNSDLDRVLERFAQAAVNRYVRLEKNPEKTNAKIRR